MLLLDLSVVRIVKVPQSTVLEIKIKIWSTTSFIFWDVGSLLVTIRLIRRSARSGVGHLEGKEDWKREMEHCQGARVY